ncbi:MAG: PAS domain S-box protein [Deltaproteobacteria bacterium]|nr:PAS domain S-box protein [Deltaproteobacteria bacterium]MBW2418393.1 PAS domain S-box protein [Deltaproteobacteria bacterium]
MKGRRRFGRVLVIEDDRDTCANLRDILQLDHYEVEVARSLAEALGREATADLAAILVDRSLPDGNADDHLKDIRMLAPDAAVLIVTGHSDLEGVVSALRHGADDYLIKPVDPDSLRAALARSVELRRTREALRESTLRSDAIVKSVQDGLVTINEAGIIEAMNPAALKIFGYEEEEVLGRNVSMLMPSPDREAHDGHIRRYLETGVGAIIGRLREVKGRRKDGSVFQHEITVSEIQLGDRRLFTGVIRDLSERNRVIAALRESEARARAAEDLASIGTLAAGLAHEIGTPMNVILGYAQMIQSAAESETVRERAGIIREQIQRVSKIIQTLLNLARPGRPLLGPVKLEDTIEATLALLQEKLRKRRIRVERSFEPVPEIRGDGEKLQQLFLNLCLNGADAMHEGGILRITLAGRGESEISVVVADTGTGIPAESLDRLFDPFYTTKDHGKGSGLGLAVVKGIVVDHGGSIGVASEIGKGTEFSIVLPLDGGSR